MAAKTTTAQRMTIKRVPTKQLVPYVRNARTHSQAQVEQIARSITEFGFNNPILIDGKKGIIAGHGRVMAAELLGLKDVPAIELSHLSEVKKRAYIIADNKLADNSGWDMAVASIEIEELADLDLDIALLGFSENELADMGVQFDFAPVEGNPTRLDQKKGATCPKCGHDFTP